MPGSYRMWLAKNVVRREGVLTGQVAISLGGRGCVAVQDNSARRDHVQHTPAPGWHLPSRIQADKRGSDQ